MEPESSSVLWIVVVGFIVAFVLAFGIGANDVANSFGTSVGAKVLTLRQACIVAGIFELAGAVLLGTKVSDTVRKGIIDIGMFVGNEKDAMVGALSALLGTSIWLIVATFFKLPVSGTHSVVGATIGYALVERGASGINWSKFGMIAASWVISPVLSGIVSSGLFVLIRRFILRRSDPFKQGLRAIPLFYGITLAINLFSIFYDSPDIFGIGHMPAYVVIAISLGVGFLVFLLVHFVIAPWLKKRILAREQLEIQRVSESHDHDRNIPELQISTDLQVLEQNGDVFTGTSTTDIATLEIPKMSDLLRRSIDPDEITIVSSLTSDDNEDTVTSQADQKDIATLQLPKNKLFRNVLEPDEITICSELSSDTLEENNAQRESVVNGEVNPQERDSGESPEANKSDIVIKLEGGDEDAHPAKREGRFSITDVSNDIDDHLPHHSTAPSTPVVGRRTDTVDLIDGPRRMSKGEESEKRLKEKTEKEHSRLLARSLVADDPKTARLFKFLQIMTASFGAFAHGGNDVSNAIGPVISIWVIYNTGLVQSKAATPVWILLYGGVGIVIGLWAWGRRVIETIGENLTPVTPTSGFCIEIGAALTVLLASNLGIPVSTTHCKVGSVVFTGRVRSRDVVDWSLFVNIVVSWIVTMPVTGLISAGVYAAITKAM